MSFPVVRLGALCSPMLVAYRGLGIILFAPLAAPGAVLLTDPSAAPPAGRGLFKDRQSCKDIFAITCIKTMAVFVVIAVYSATGIV